MSDAAGKGEQIRTGAMDHAEQAGFMVPSLFY